MEDVKYFQKKLYGALCVPISRLEPNQGFSLGRTSEITRDELKFSKFVDRLRNKFSDVFNQALRVQCVLKGICTDEEFELFKENIHYDFIKDNNFSELKEAELISNRLTLLQSVDPYTGRYFSQKWIQQNVLRLTDDEIEEMDTQIEKEKEMGLGLPVGVTNDVAQQQMLGQVQTDQMVQQAELMPDQGQGNSGGGSSSKPKSKSSSSSKPVKGDLSLEEVENTFTRLKRIL